VSSVGTSVLVITAFLLGALAAEAAQREPVVTQKAGDAAVRLLVEGGQLIIGVNDVALEFSSASGRHEVSEVRLVATQAGSTGAPVSVSLSPDAEGQFHGTMVLTSIANCRLAVSWQEAGGPHSLTFTVPVAVGHH
jgi:hypothetical protein